MKTFLRGLAALCLSVGVTSQARAQEYTFTTIEPFGSNGSTASGITDDGQIVGNYGDGNGIHGFLLSGGTYSTLDGPGIRYTIAWGINLSGEIVGWYNDSSFRLHGFLLSDGDYTTTRRSTRRTPPIRCPLGSTPAARSWERTITMASC